MRSFFGRLNYEYAYKYLFEANLRADGSSRFAPDSRWGIFPSFSAGWRISEEAFWNFHHTVDNLKLRTSWGQLGNNSIGNYDWQDVYTAANYSFNGTVVKGLSASAIANNLISWETTDVFNLGIDVGLFRKLTLSLEYYNKFTHGILYRNPIPYVNGGLTAPMVNSAEVRNRGFEGDISYHTAIGRDFTFSIGFNGSVNRNRIMQYKGDLLESHGQGVWTEGQPIDKFYVREIDHIVQDKAEIDQLVADGWTFSPVTPGPGDFLYKDRNGDKKINDDDRVLKGNPFPVFTYGGNLSAQYKGFDFYTLITGVSGWDKYTSASFFSFSVTPGYLFNTKYMDSWTETNHSTTIPKIYISDARNQQTSTYHLHDASYFRVKTLQLGYTVPPAVTRSIKIDRIRVYVNLENFFTFTSYPGMDPETTSSANSADVNYPLMKTVSCGLNVNF
jgi:TonB-linked SusC/RagA family outer membrane protein